MFHKSLVILIFRCHFEADIRSYRKQLFVFYVFITVSMRFLIVLELNGVKRLQNLVRLYLTISVAFVRDTRLGVVWI